LRIAAGGGRRAEILKLEGFAENPNESFGRGYDHEKKKKRRETNREDERCEAMR